MHYWRRFRISKEHPDSKAVRINHPWLQRLHRYNSSFFTLILAACEYGLAVKTGIEQRQNPPRPTKKKQDEDAPSVHKRVAAEPEGNQMRRRVRDVEPCVCCTAASAKSPHGALIEHSPGPRAHACTAGEHPPDTHPTEASSNTPAAPRRAKSGK